MTILTQERVIFVDAPCNQWQRCRGGVQVYKFSRHMRLDQTIFSEFGTLPFQLLLVLLLPVSSRWEQKVDWEDELALKGADMSWPFAQLHHIRSQSLCEIGPGQEFESLPSLASAPWGVRF